MLNISDDEKCSKLKGLYNYLKQNQNYIVNYEERKRLGKTFTSQVAESHIESIINARHKRVERCNGPVKERTTFFKSAQKSLAKPGQNSGNR